MHKLPVIFATPFLALAFFAGCSSSVFSKPVSENVFFTLSGGNHEVVFSDNRTVLENVEKMKQRDSKKNPSSSVTANLYGAPSLSDLSVTRIAGDTVITLKATNPYTVGRFSGFLVRLNCIDATNTVRQKDIAFSVEEIADYDRSIRLKSYEIAQFEILAAPIEPNQSTQLSITLEKTNFRECFNVIIRGAW